MRNREFIFTAVLCAGLFSSCAREIQPIDNEEHPDYQTIEFRATTEMAKTAISGDGTSKTVQWTKGDVIDILWDGGQTTATASVSGPITTFRASVPDGVQLYASYPAGVGELSGSELTVGIPSTVSGRFNEVNMLAASINRNSDEATVFHNVASYLKFTVAGDANANKIYISSRHTGDGETPVFTGSWPLTFDENGNVTIGEPTPDKKDITVMIAGDGDYYVPVIPDYVYPDGFSILYYSSNSNTYALEADFDFRLDKAYIANFGVVSSTFSPVKVMKYYVTVAGSGKKDGSDWANAMGKNEFKSIITRWDAYVETDPDSRETAKQKEASLNNATFYIAEGTYDFGEIVELGFSNHCKRSINFTFDGGYYNNGLKDPAGHPTVFSGGNSHNIFKICRYADFGAADCVFANSKGSSGGDAAIWFDDSHGKITLTNCILRDNSNTATAAAISIGKGSAHLIGCTFSGNSATYAPALNIDNDKSSVSYKDVIVESCTFDGNYASVEAGAIRCASGGPVTVSNSTFINNTTDTYGAVMVCSGAPATFTGCTFGTENNGNVSTKSGGVARVRTSEVTFDNCTFGYNKGQYGGAISMESSHTPVVTVKDCHFLNCTTPTDASNQGGAIMQDAGTLTVTGSTFDNCQSKDGGVYSIAGGSASFTGCDFGKTTRNGASAGGGCIYTFNSAAPVFTNCTISGNANTGGGVATSTTSHPSFTGCTFTNCLATLGGAVHTASNSAPTFENCTMNTNTASGDGGAAIYTLANSNVTLTDCTVSGNTGDWGGAMVATGNSVLTVSGGTYSGNHAKGGGLINQSGTSTVEFKDNALIKENYATGGHGGAILYQSTELLSCTNVTFEGNYNNTTSGAWGGAIGTTSNGVFSITGCTFTGNHSKYMGGPAINLQGAINGSISGCTFIGNYSESVNADNSGSYGGGAMRLNSTGTVTVDNCYFEGNHLAKYSADKSAYGGAIYINSGGTYKFNGCKFKDNYATMGGAIGSFAGGATIYMNACGFDGNYISYKNGTTIHIRKASTFCMNNCSINDNTYTEINDASWFANWIFFEGKNSDGSNYVIDNICLSNNSFIGCPRYTSSKVASTTNQNSIIRFGDGDFKPLGSSGKYYAVNNIVVTNEEEGKNLSFSHYSGKVNAYYTRRSDNSANGAGGSYDMGGITTNKYQKSYFSGLAWNSTNMCWTWNGTMTGGESKTSYADAATAVSKINNIPGFKTWLESIGALYKDQLGNNRPTSGSWWSGAYQGN